MVRVFDCSMIKAFQSAFSSDAANAPLVTSFLDFKISKKHSQHDKALNLHNEIEQHKPDEHQFY